MNTKIDRRRTYYLVLDTETCNTLEEPIVYDIGGVITDRHGNIYEEFSFIVRDVFMGMAELMNTAYYANKIPNYWVEIAKGERVIKTYYEIHNHIHELAKRYNIKAIVAYNTPFDYRSCTTTQRYLTYSKYRYFFPYGVELYDALKMARDTICKQKSYIDFCERHDYLTKNGKPKATAEIVYRYINGDNEFIEAHTAHEDAVIEAKIFSKCMRQHKRMRKTAFSN